MRRRNATLRSRDGSAGARWRLEAWRAVEGMESRLAHGSRAALTPINPRGARAATMGHRNPGKSALMKTGQVCNRAVVSTRADANLSEVSRLMRESHVGSVIVVDDAT